MSYDDEDSNDDMRPVSTGAPGGKTRAARRGKVPEPDLEPGSEEAYDEYIRNSNAAKKKEQQQAKDAERRAKQEAKKREKEEQEEENRRVKEEEEKGKYEAMQSKLYGTKNQVVRQPSSWRYIVNPYFYARPSGEELRALQIEVAHDNIDFDRLMARSTYILSGRGSRGDRMYYNAAARDEVEVDAATSERAAAWFAEVAQSDKDAASYKQAMLLQREQEESAERAKQDEEYADARMKRVLAFRKHERSLEKYVEARQEMVAVLEKRLDADAKAFAIAKAKEAAKTPVKIVDLSEIEKEAANLKNYDSAVAIVRGLEEDIKKTELLLTQLEDDHKRATAALVKSEKDVTVQKDDLQKAEEDPTRDDKLIATLQKQLNDAEGYRTTDSKNVETINTETAAQTNNLEILQQKWARARRVLAARQRLERNNLEQKRKTEVNENAADLRRRMKILLNHDEYIQDRLKANQNMLKEAAKSINSTTATENIAVQTKLIQDINVEVSNARTLYDNAITREQEMEIKAIAAHLAALPNTGGTDTDANIKAAKAADKEVNAAIQQRTYARKVFEDRAEDQRQAAYALAAAKYVVGEQQKRTKIATPPITKSKVVLSQELRDKAKNIWYDKAVDNVSKAREDVVRQGEILEELHTTLKVEEKRLAAATTQLIGEGNVTPTKEEIERTESDILRNRAAVEAAKMSVTDQEKLLALAKMQLTNDELVLKANQEMSRETLENKTIADIELTKSQEFGLADDVLQQRKAIQQARGASAQTAFEEEFSERINTDVSLTSAEITLEGAIAKQAAMDAAVTTAVEAHKNAVENWGEKKTNLIQAQMNVEPEYGGKRTEAALAALYASEVDMEEANQALGESHKILTQTAHAQMEAEHALMKATYVARIVRASWPELMFSRDNKLKVQEYLTVAIYNSNRANETAENAQANLERRRAEVQQAQEDAVEALIVFSKSEKNEGARRALQEAKDAYTAAQAYMKIAEIILKEAKAAQAVAQRILSAEIATAKGLGLNVNDAEREVDKEATEAEKQQQERAARTIIRDRIISIIEPAVFAHINTEVAKFFAGSDSLARQVVKEGVDQTLLLLDIQIYTTQTGTKGWDANAETTIVTTVGNYIQNISDTFSEKPDVVSRVQFTERGKDVARQTLLELVRNVDAKADVNRLYGQPTRLSTASKNNTFDPLSTTAKRRTSTRKKSGSTHNTRRANTSMADMLEPMEVLAPVSVKANDQEVVEWIVPDNDDDFPDFDAAEPME